MSLLADRAAIATALSTVAGVTGYNEPPPLMSVGDAWGRWGGYNASGAPLTYTSTWRIDVICGGTPTDATIWLDAHLDNILDSLDQLLYVLQVEPVVFQIPSSGELHGAEITCQKES